MIFTGLLTLFIALPILELAVILKVHRAMGLGPTLLIIIVTGIVGASLARWQGLMTVVLIRRDLAEGKMPAPRVMDGVMILLAGAFLVTPGLITDAAGFLLLVPHVRYRIRMWMKKKLEEKLKDGSMNITFHGSGAER